MKANPGGQLGTNEVIGREALIKRIRRSLDRQSVILTSERRIGKTTVLRKMEELADAEKEIVFYSDVEGITSPLEFVEHLLQTVEPYLSVKQKAATKFRGLLNQIAGTELGGVIKLPPAVAVRWKDLLTGLIGDLAEQEDKNILFFWDEVPLMLYKISRRNEGGETEAMEMLDIFRALRQKHRNLRMIFTGSIGLHNVLTGLQKAGYANDPTNDMMAIDVPPLDKVFAERLALLLMTGENLKTSVPEEIARVAASETGGFAYYIHHVIEEMANRAGGAGEVKDFTADDVREIVADALTEEHDRWHLEWYYERLSKYYEAEECAVALPLLDILAATETEMSFEELFNLVKHKIAADSEQVRRILNRLGKDHYTLRNTSGAYVFRFPLIKRFWRLRRGV